MKQELSPVNSPAASTTSTLNRVRYLCSKVQAVFLVRLINTHTHLSSSPTSPMSRRMSYKHTSSFVVDGPTWCECVRPSMYMVFANRMTKQWKRLQTAKCHQIAQNIDNTLSLSLTPTPTNTHTDWFYLVQTVPTLSVDINHGHKTCFDIKRKRMLITWNLETVSHAKRGLMQHKQGFLFEITQAVGQRGTWLGKTSWLAD